MKRRGRWAPLGALTCAVALHATGARADNPARACIAAHADGQVERDAGRLLVARERFLACAVESCPELVRRECLLLRENLQAVLPSVVLFPTDAAGGRQEAASVTIDGRAHEAQEGRAIELDPGTHRIEVQLKDGRRQSVSVLLRETEKARRVVIKFPEQGPSYSPLVYVFGGLGVVALGAFVGFGIDGNNQERELERSCAPNCKQRDVDNMRRSHLIADVSLAVSLASFGAGTYFLLRSPDEPTGQRATRGLMLDVTGKF